MMGDRSRGSDRVPRIPWTREEDAELLRMKDAGESLAAISAALSRSPKSTFSRWEHLRRMGERERAKPRTKRPCLCCKKPFMSEGAHNRLCNECKNNEQFGVPSQFHTIDTGFRGARRTR